MIYVQIAAYRDPELVPTIVDCLNKAKFPHDLRFGVCWQRGQDDLTMRPFARDKRFRIDEVPWQESKGLCWARSRIQKMYDGEAYTLQIDSHHRFVKDWDAQLLEMFERTGSQMPILTTYAPVYHPRTNRCENTPPSKMVAERFTPSGTILFRPKHMPEWRDLSKPVRARFVSGHFFFTLGRHCTEYRYDPQLYFAGDEISLSIRSFTLGYDLFHPHRNVIWHEYTREGRPKHWGDHSEKNKDQIEMTWDQRDDLSKRRLRKLLKEEDNDADISGYGLGTVRTHSDYERYAGIDFSHRRLHKDAILGVEPPSVYQDEEHWTRSFLVEFKLTLEWDIERVERCDDYDFIYFGVEDDVGNVLLAYDAPSGSEEAKLAVARKEISIRSHFKPAKLVVWPVSKSRGWLKRVDYPL